MQSFTEGMALYEIVVKFFVVRIILSALRVSITTAQAIPGCPETCGNLTIPYPFGTREGCYLNQTYLITCNDTTAYLRKTDLETLHISLEGQLRIRAQVAYDCYNKNGNRTLFSEHGIWLSNFPISSKRNKFTAIGCDTNAMIQGFVGQRYMTGCMSLCGRFKDVRNGSCNGIGCCQTSIPEGVRDYSITVGSFNNHYGIWNFSRCSYAFVAEEEEYNFSSTDLNRLRKESKFPLIVDWAVGDASCVEAQTNLTSYLCKENSTCYDSDNGPGYHCKCLEGYSGNPYLQNGCKGNEMYIFLIDFSAFCYFFSYISDWYTVCDADLDECGDSRLNDCTHICSNSVGNYSCSCPKGYHGDGRRNGQGCILYKRHPPVAPVVTAGKLS